MAQRLSLTSVVFALVLLAFPAAARQDQKFALVIGNARYAEAPLRNPVNDARAMAQALRARGFEVMLRENATRSQMESAVVDFGEKLTEDATGLFFFAGHGMQVQGRNYLIPVDAKITSEQRVKVETVDVELILDQMQAARSKVSMLILDACRNNPFERRFRSLNGGLAQINAPEGTLIAYATAPGKVAADGDGSNGLYTQEFLKALSAPGLKVEDVFKQVRINVSRASNGMQVPWEASSLTGDFYFVAPAPATPVAAAPTTNPADMALWDAVKASVNPAEIKVYLDQFPNGLFAGVARTRLAALNQPAPAATAPRPMPAAVSAPPPAAATPTPLPAPVPAPQQQAALPPARDSGLEGRYTARINGPRGLIEATLNVNDRQLTGFGVVVNGDSMANGFSNRLCRITGSIDQAAVIERMEVDCGYYSWRFSGRFGPDNDGQYSATTSAQSVTAGNLTVIWKKAAGS